MSVDPVVAPDEQLSVEVDGYRLTLPGRSGVFEVTDVATGEVVVASARSARGPRAAGSRSTNRASPSPIRRRARCWSCSPQDVLEPPRASSSTRAAASRPRSLAARIARRRAVRARRSRRCFRRPDVVGGERQPPPAAVGSRLAGLRPRLIRRWPTSKRGTWGEIAGLILRPGGARVGVHGVDGVVATVGRGASGGCSRRGRGVSVTIERHDRELGLVGPLGVARRR